MAALQTIAGRIYGCYCTLGFASKRRKLKRAHSKHPAQACDALEHNRAVVPCKVPNSQLGIDSTEPDLSQNTANPLLVLFRLGAPPLMLPPCASWQRQ